MKLYDFLGHFCPCRDFLSVILSWICRVWAVSFLVVGIHFSRVNQGNKQVSSITYIQLLRCNTAMGSSTGFWPVPPAKAKSFLFTECSSKVGKNKSPPGQSRSDPVQTDRIYSIKNRLQGVQKGATSCWKFRSLVWPFEYWTK